MKSLYNAPSVIIGHISSACDKPTACSRFGGAHALPESTSEAPSCSNFHQDNESASHQFVKLNKQYCIAAVHSKLTTSAKSSLSKTPKQSASAQVQGTKGTKGMRLPVLHHSQPLLLGLEMSSGTRIILSVNSQLQQHAKQQ